MPQGTTASTRRWRSQLAGALLFLLALWPARNFVADAIAAEGLGLLWDWDRGGTVDAAAIPAGIASFKLAAVIRPGYPDYLEGIARLADYAGRAAEPGSALGRAAVARAIPLFRAAADARPTWARTRARALVAKAKLGEFDAEFDQWLLEAEQFGPYEPEVLHMVIIAGFHGLDRLGGESGERVWRAAERALDHADPAFATRSATLLERMGRRAATCERLSTTARRTHYIAICT